MGKFTLAEGAKTDDFFKAFFRFLEETLDNKSKAIIERHKAEIEKEVEAMRLEVLASAAVRISKQVQIETLANRLVIEIMREDKNA